MQSDECRMQNGGFSPRPFRTRAAFAFSFCILHSAFCISAARAADDKVTFQDHVLPVFRNACLNCHNADKKRAELDISTFSATMAGSDSNKAIIPGDPDSSL